MCHRKDPRSVFGSTLLKDKRVMIIRFAQAAHAIALFTKGLLSTHMAGRVWAGRFQAHPISGN